MLRVVATQLGAVTSRVALSKEVARPSLTSKMVVTPKVAENSLITKFDLFYQSESLKELVKFDNPDMLIKEILNCEKKNKTTRKVAKKHRKKKGKTVNLRRC